MHSSRYLLTLPSMAKALGQDGAPPTTKKACFIQPICHCSNPM